jgi:hypothetical protein
VAHFCQSSPKTGAISLAHMGIWLAWLGLFLSCSAMVLSGCGSTPAGDEADGGGGCNPAQGEVTDDACPVPPVTCELASDGDSCETVGKSCDASDGCHEYEVVCEDDHHWWFYEEEDSCCSQTCPDTIPDDFDSCDLCGGVWCTYTVDTECGPQEVHAGCSLGTTDFEWHVTPTDPCQT